MAATVSQMRNGSKPGSTTASGGSSELQDEGRRATSLAQPDHRRPGVTLYRYLVRETIFPTLFALLALTVVVLTKDLLGFSDLVINRGLSAGTVASIAFYETIPLLSRTLPFAMLMGCLVALGRLGADRELLIIEASGVSTPRLVGPVMVFATLTALIACGFSLFAAPWASRSLDASFHEISRSNPAAVIQAGTVHRFGDWKLEAREASAAGDRIGGVLLWMPDIGETVFAKRGILEPVPGGGTSVRLEQGTVLLNPRKRPRELRFEAMTAMLPTSDEPITRNYSDRIKGATFGELAEFGRARAAEGAEGRNAREALVELHRRFALPAAALVFGLLVIPLFLSRTQFSRSGGFVMGISATLVYYGLVQLGSGLIQSRTVGVVLGVWLPNLILAAIALAMLFRLTRMSSFGRHADRPQRVALRTTGAAARRLRPRRWALQRYVAGRFAVMAVLAFSLLVVAYLLVDVLERLEWFARYRASGPEILRYYLARIPLLASRVIPMALLVATALTVSLLAVQGELVGMRSCGIPAARALAPILVICTLIVPLYFVLNNEVLPYSNALQTRVKNVEIRNRAPDRRSRAEVWYRVGSNVYSAEQLDARVGRAVNITIYELGEDALPVSRTDALEARHIGGGVWRLHEPVRIEISPEGLTRVPAAPFAELGEDVPAEVDTRHLSVGELRREIAELEQDGRRSVPYEVDLWVKLATPIACLVLPALALFFAIGGPPYPGSAVTLVMSVVVSVSYVLLTGVGTSLGYGEALSPSIAGWGPIGLFALLAAYLGLRLRAPA